jgi:hypothetical protein
MQQAPFLSYENLSRVHSALLGRLEDDGGKMNTRILVARIMHDIHEDSDLVELTQDEKNEMAVSAALEFYIQS